MNFRPTPSKRDVSCQNDMNVNRNAAGESGASARSHSAANGIARVENITVSLADASESGASAISLAEQLQAMHMADHSSISFARTPVAPCSYLEKVEIWRREALQTAQSPEEANGINTAALKIRQWVEDNNLSKHLVLVGLSLRSLPELPEGLMTVDMGENFLKQLPVLPQSLVELGVAFNQLEILPEIWPPYLRALDIHDNRVRRLPDQLPAALDVCDARNNCLVSLPEIFPKDLTEFLIEGNPITSLPEGILALSQECSIYLGAIPLSSTVFERLRETVFAADYHGPLFYISRESAVVVGPSQALSSAVACWYSSEYQKSAQEIWQRFDKIEEAGDFSAFLDRLRDSIHYSRAEFKLEITHWLDQLALDKELRTLVFTIAKEAIGSCEDRAALTLNAMRQAQLNLEIERGKYDNKIAELIAIGRQMFRLNELEAIARKKAASLRLVDEIEVYLAYQVKLQKILDLPLTATQMRFFDVSYVTQANLDDAVRVIKKREEKEFLNYLASEWGPWKTVLKSWSPSLYEATQEKLSALTDQEFVARRKAWCVSQKLADNEANRIKATPIVLKQISNEVWGELTQHFLSRQKIKLSSL